MSKSPSNSPTNADDIRSLDLDVEASRHGFDDYGMPYYVWRESADNRMGLSRPRYCCISAVGDELMFTFFNPSEDIKSNGSEKAFVGVCAAMAVLFVVSMIAGRYQSATGPGDHGVPPLMALISFTGTALILGGLTFWVWNSIATILSWRRDRFQGDGRLYSVPWRHLEAFQVVTPEETGVKREKDVPKTGHGMLATFGNAASPMALTANVWNYRSIIDQHREKTLLFVDGRDEKLAEWNAYLKRKKKKDDDGNGGAGNGPTFDL